MLTQQPALSKPAIIVGGLILAAIAAAQQFIIDAPAGVHTAILLTVTTFAALGLTVSDAVHIGSFIPHQLALYLTLAANLLQALNGLVGIPNTVHAAIAAAVVFLVTIGIKPQAQLVALLGRLHIDGTPTPLPPVNPATPPVSGQLPPKS